MASLAEQLVRQLGVRPEHLQLDPRKWAPIFRSGAGVQRTSQGESRSSEGIGTSGGGGGGNAGIGTAPSTGMRDKDDLQISESRERAQTSAKQATTRHGLTCASL